MQNQTYNNEIIFLVEEDIEGGYNAKAMGFPIFTQAETIDELKEMIDDAVRCHFKTLPQMIRLHFVRDEVMAV
ncbi:2-oxoisovalerate dehydrogenase [bacterium]|nr:2-oxoisovalerate dehydrogenase [bacterium]